MKKIFQERTVVGSWCPPAMEDDEYAHHAVVVVTTAHYDQKLGVLVVDGEISRGGYCPEILATHRVMESHPAEAAAIRAAVAHADHWQAEALAYTSAA